MREAVSLPLLVHTGGHLPEMPFGGKRDGPLCQSVIQVAVQNDVACLFEIVHETGVFVVFHPAMPAAGSCQSQPRAGHSDGVDRDDNGFGVVCEDVAGGDDADGHGSLRHSSTTTCQRFSTTSKSSDASKGR